MLLGHFVRHIESIHVEQVVQHSDVIAFESIEFKIDHQKWPESPKTSVLEDVALSHLLHQGRSEVHGLGLVVGVLGEAKSFVDVELRQVDDDGAIGRWDVGHVDHPATLDRDRKRPGEIRRMYDAFRIRQMTTAKRLQVRGNTRRIHTAEIQKKKDAGYGRLHLRSINLAYNSALIIYFSRYSEIKEKRARVASVAILVAAQSATLLVSFRIDVAPS